MFWFHYLLFHLFLLYKISVTCTFVIDNANLIEYNNIKFINFLYSLKNCNQ